MNLAPELFYWSLAHTGSNKGNPYRKGAAYISFAKQIQIAEWNRGDTEGGGGGGGVKTAQGQRYIFIAGF
jgi:hypothetical protein